MVNVAVVGSREYPYPEDVSHFVSVLYHEDVEVRVISGGARGVDSWAEETAEALGIPVLVHEAKWDEHGKSAGFIRNRLIVRDADVVVAFWDGESKGTAHTITTATQEMDRATYIAEPFRTLHPTDDALRHIKALARA